MTRMSPSVTFSDAGPNPARSHTLPLPGDVLLTVFGFYLARPSDGWERRPQSRWLPLSRVSGQWRRVLFQYARSLRLCIKWNPHFCSITAEEISQYPGFPLHITIDYFRELTDADMDLFHSAVQHLHYAYTIEIKGFSSVLCRLIPYMDKPAPELENLTLWADEPALSPPSIITFPDGFLEGAIPRLHHLRLFGVPPFPLSLLRSESIRFTTLQTLNLELPETGYISPDSFLVLDYLPMMSQLEELRVAFPKSTYGLGSHKRVSAFQYCSPIVVPCLKRIHFRCASAWIEAVFAAIDAPALWQLRIRFTDNEIISSPELAAFISRTFASPFVFTKLSFDGEASRVWIHDKHDSTSSWRIYLKIGYPAYNIQLASFSNIFASLAARLSSVEHFDISAFFPPEHSGLWAYFEYGHVTREWLRDIEPGLVRSLLTPLLHLHKLDIGPAFVSSVESAINAELGGPPGILPRLAFINVAMNGDEMMYDEEGLVSCLQPFVDQRQQMGQEVQLVVTA
ncbi:hypothetical protein BC834DRAFT_1041373 [Gloeopeniophorella convolvens]|nr:hypothetical protein BC834DRAFT_1041373 [Gloeopeniophorella convolvens]